MLSAMSLRKLGLARDTQLAQDWLSLLLTSQSDARGYRSGGISYE